MNYVLYKQLTIFTVMSTLTMISRLMNSEDSQGWRKMFMLEILSQYTLSQHDQLKLKMFPPVSKSHV